jgi:hypothetical protein
VVLPWVIKWAYHISHRKRHVLGGRRIVERQREIVARKKAAGIDATLSKELLQTFQITPVTFEDDLAALLAEVNRNARATR